MSTLRLPTFKANHDHEYRCVLDSDTYTIEWHYNTRAQRWSVHVFDASGAAVRHGVRLVVINDLLRRVALSTKPPGPLNVIDTTGADTEPTEANLGDESQLRYVEA